MKYAVWICVFAQTLLAHDIITTNLTYTRDISRIMARHCSGCHGAQSAIPLTSYEEVRPWAVGIKEQVLSRAMPPWGAVKGFGNFKPDESLGQEDIMTIAAWVIGGAPKGDTALLPKTSTPTAVHVAPAGRSLTGTTRLLLEASVTCRGDSAGARAAGRIRTHCRDPAGWTRRAACCGCIASIRSGSARLSFASRSICRKERLSQSSAPLRFLLETR